MKGSKKTSVLASVLLFVVTIVAVYQFGFHHGRSGDEFCRQLGITDY